MKVAVRCESPLLQRSLEIFLHDNLSSIKQCDVVIRDKAAPDDQHPTLLIGTSADADLVKPFSRSQLVMTIEKIGLDAQPIRLRRAQESRKEQKDVTVLEQRIALLTQEYQENILKTVREFYAE